MIERLGGVDDIHGFTQFVFILFALYSLLVVWKRYRKIEIVGICGIAKWFGIHKFYVTDLEKRYGKIGYHYAGRENYSIYSMKYHRYIFHKTENDEGHESISGCITNPPKGYCQELPVGKNTESGVGFLFSIKNMRLINYINMEMCWMMQK